MKKIALILIAALTLTIVGCQKTEAPVEATPAVEATTEATTTEAPVTTEAPAADATTTQAN